MADFVRIVGINDVNKLIRELPDHLFDSAKKEISTTILNVQREVISYKRGLKNRSGRLRRSIKTKLLGNNLNRLSGRVFTEVNYAPLQEEGGTITARDKYLRVPGGPYLNIPLSSNKTANGVTRLNAREVFAHGGFIIKSKNQKWLVMNSIGIPMFVLVKQVTVPARLGMQDSADDEVPNLLSSLSRVLLRGL